MEKNYVFDKDVKSIISFPDKKEKQMEFNMMYNEILEIIQKDSITLPRNLIDVFHDEVSREKLRKIFDFYDTLPIGFCYPEITNYIKQCYKIAGLDTRYLPIINSFDDVFKTFEELYNKELKSLTISNGYSRLNMFLNAIRLVLMSYAKEVEKVSSISNKDMITLKSYLECVEYSNSVDENIVNEIAGMLKNRKIFFSSIIKQGIYDSETFFLKTLEAYNRRCELKRQGFSDSVIDKMLDDPKKS